MKTMTCDQRSDPVARMVRDLTADEFVAWLVEYHGLPQSSASTVEMNLREQYKWHRLQGRLDQNTTAGLVAQLFLIRRSPLTLAKPVDPDGVAK